MRKIKNFIFITTGNLKSTVSRFPAVLLYLLFLTGVTFIQIEQPAMYDRNILIRLLFTGTFAAMLAVMAQFKIERFEILLKYKIAVNISTLIIASLYYLFITDDLISRSMLIHSFVLNFAVFSSYLYMPCFRNDMNFGNIALSHFKAAFTAILYAVVLYLGFAAIFGAINILLFKINWKVYEHLANFVFILFAPFYYLSLLPFFNSKESKDDNKKELSYNYPKVLDILVSYITIPLISIFTLVLFIYFIKILVTGVWPVGQVGPMVLGYSAVGYFLYILSSNLENNFSLYFKRLYPAALIPLVLMQFVSSFIRINAYGMTESRYYVVLFGIFSITSAIFLLMNKKKNPKTIVLLAAVFAVLSILPPIDAFTISKNSQRSRLEEILSSNNMLVNDEIIPNADISNMDKYEVTNISNYMWEMGYLKDISWFQSKNLQDFEYYAGFKDVYGFSPYYDKGKTDEEQKYVYAMVDDKEQIDIEGYDRFINVTIFNGSVADEIIGTVSINNINYNIVQKSEADGNVSLLISRGENDILAEIPLRGFTDRLFSTGTTKSTYKAEEMTEMFQNENFNIKIVAVNISIDKSDPKKLYINGNLYIFIKTKI